MDILGAASVHGCEAATVEVVPARTLPNDDVILAAQALTLGAASVVVATTNTAHLARFVPAELWQNIAP